MKTKKGTTLPSGAALNRVREAHNYTDRNERADDAASLRNQTWEHMEAIMADSAARGQRGELLASERRDYDDAEALLVELEHIANESRVDRRGVVTPVDDTPAYRKGAPLAQGQSFAGYVRAMGHGEPEEAIQAADGRQLSLSKYLKGAFTGDWHDAEPERILNAQTGAAGGSGGVLIPTVLTADLIDQARNQARVLQAGARVVPMTNRTADVPRWLSDPEPQWRAEGDPIAEDDATLDKITLEAKSLAVVTKVTRELVEDTNIDDQLRAAFAAAFLRKIDWAALYGDGTNDSPTGVKATAAVTKTPLATNGATPTWAALVNAVGRLRDVNEEPNAQIMSDRTLRSLSLLEANDGSYVAPPSYLEGIDRYTTAQVPNDNDEGTATGVASDLFTADWSQLYLGVRTQLVVTTLTERFMPDAGQYGFVAWWRGDVAVARPKAFDVVTGVLA